MFLLKKLFQAREKVAEKRTKWDDVEKPFLDHLDDLRKMLMRIAITLAVAMTVCFVFDKELLEIVRYPVKMAGLDSIDGSRLPEGIRESDWGKVKDMSRAMAALEGPQRQAFLNRVPAELRDATLATLYFRAALTLPMPDRVGFVEEMLPDGPQRKLALFLVDQNPNAHIDDSGQLLRMTALGPAETFTLSLKLSFFAGIVLSFPLLLWFVAEFIMPGLTKEERRMVLPSVVIGFVLFTVGVCFAYYIVAPKALRFFYEYSLRLGVISDWRIGYFVSFVTQFTLIFGLCFELPVVVMAMVKLGLLSHSTMINTRSYAVVAIFVVGALITPTTDALTLFMLAGPMIVLYEICIWLAWFIERKEKRLAEKEEKDWQERMLVPAVATDATGATATDSDGTDHDDEWKDPYADGDDPYHHHDDPYHRGEVDADGLPIVEPAPDAVSMPDPDDLPPDWGHSEDPYAPVSESDTEIPEPPPGDELPPGASQESPHQPEDQAHGKEIPPQEPPDSDPPEPKNSP